jgi:hypothetical protein
LQQVRIMRQDRSRYSVQGSRLSVRGGKQKRSRNATQRKHLLAETLEPRALLAGDISPFWNYYSPTDVNADGYTTGLDALMIVNELNISGARNLQAATSGGGEGEGPSQNYYDVNNDGWITGLDAITIVNRLNGEGEGNPYARLVLQPVALNTNDVITTITKGQSYELRVLTVDLGETMFMSQTRNTAISSGVGQSYFDVNWNTTQTEVQLNEVQAVTINGSPTGGTFRLTINGQQTANITFTTNVNQTAAAIQSAVDTLFGANRIEVRGSPTGPSPNRYTLRYLNQFSNVDQNEAANSGNAGSLTGGTSPTIMFSEVIKGATVASSLSTAASVPAVVTDALAPRSIPDGFGGFINEPYYPAARTGNLVTTGINDVGGLINVSGAIPGLVPREILRVRMNAIDGTGGTPLTFNASLLNVVSPGGDTVLVGFGNALTSLNRGDTAMDIMSRVEIVSLPLTITETVSAVADSGSINEDATVAVQINVVSNDTKTTGGTLAILGNADTTGTVGTVTKINSTTFSYLPPANFSGTTTFKYTVTNGLTPAVTDTAVVTITVNAVNDAPVNSVPTSTQLITEGSPLILSSMNGNAITVNDIDADPGTIQVRLQTPAGVNIALGSVAGLTSVSGNNSNDVTLVGTQAIVNSALNNTIVTPQSEFSGGFGITVTSSDLGNTGIGGTLTDSDTINVSVAAVNDAPVVNLGFSGTQMVLEGEALVFNSPSRLISFSDIDAGSSPVQVTLSVTNAGNKLKLASTAGLTFVSGDDSNNVVIRGPLTAVNTAVAGLTYTAGVGFGGQNDTLTINLNDQGNTGSPGALFDQKTVTIAVDTLVRPFARPDTLTVSENSSAGVSNTVNVLMNDLVNLPDPGPINYFATLLTFSATSANGGSITRNDNGTPGVLTDDLLVYVPLADFSGTDTFTYTMNDTKGTGANSTGTVTVTVTEINNPPVAVDDPLTAIAEDSGVRTIPFSTLLGNDNAGPLEGGQSLNITAVSNAVGGTVSISGTNVLFTPTLNFNGNASFDYTITDNGTTNGVPAPLTDVGQVTFTITEVNDAPVAGNDPLSSIAEDSGDRTISFASLLGNDTRGGGTDENGQTLTIISVGSAVGGTVSISGTDVIFSPTLNFNGAASFSYTIEDNGTTAGALTPLTANGTVSFTVTPVNDPPVAVADLLYSTVEDITLTINAAAGVLANDSDVDGNPLTAIKLTDPNPSTGTLTAFNANGSFTFVPATDFTGIAEFTYQANDGLANSNIVTVRITITDFNDPPTAGNFNFSTNEDTLLVVNTPGLVGAPTSDPEGSPLSVSIVQAPATGTLTNNGNGSFSYLPASNASGTVSFTYRVNDGFQNSTNVGTVTINVIEQNDNPTAVNDGSLANPLVAIKNFVSQPFVNQPFNVLMNDSIAPDINETLTITAVQSPTAAGGTVTIGTGGNVLYTPLQGYEGADQFTYTITDSRGGVATATVFLNVVNFIPTDITGAVFYDSNGNGARGVGEAGLSGIDVTLSGTDLLTQLPITPITVQTKMDGSYIFPAVRPGTYTITQEQTAGLRDGVDTAGNGGQTMSANDQIMVTLPLLGIIGGSNGHNFAELGVDANQLVNPAGLYKENISSSTSKGLVLSESLGGDLMWSWALQGWNGIQGMSIAVDSDQSAATLTVVDGAGSHNLRIFVDPYDVRNTSRPTGSLARFRILGHNFNGDMLIRVDGTAAEFGMTLVANGAGAGAGEGEFSEGVDAVMAAEAWA